MRDVKMSALPAERVRNEEWKLIGTDKEKESVFY